MKVVYEYESRRAVNKRKITLDEADTDSGRLVQFRFEAADNTYHPGDYTVIRISAPSLDMFVNNMELIKLGYKELADESIRRFLELKQMGGGG